MEIKTTVGEASQKLEALQVPAETLVRIIIEEDKTPKKSDLLERLNNFVPIEIGNKDIVETIREEREKLDIRIVAAEHG